MLSISVLADEVNMITEHGPGGYCENSMRPSLSGLSAGLALKGNSKAWPFILCVLGTGSVHSGYSIKLVGRRRNNRDNMELYL